MGFAVDPAAFVAPMVLDEVAIDVDSACSDSTAVVTFVMDIREGDLDEERTSVTVPILRQSSDGRTDPVGNLTFRMDLVGDSLVSWTRAVMANMARPGEPLPVPGGFAMIGSCRDLGALAGRRFPGHNPTQGR